MAKYYQTCDGEWLAIVRKGFKRACCDCGSVHVEDYRIIKQGGKAILLRRSVKDNRATGQMRRWMKNKKV